MIMSLSQIQYIKIKIIWFSYLPDIYFIKRIRYLSKKENKAKKQDRYFIKSTLYFMIKNSDSIIYPICTLRKELI